jgi:biotin transport system ATP-binding protein
MENNALFSLSNVSMRFPGANGGEIAALDGVSFDVRRGECLVLSGANGSGKTVLMKILAGLLEPSGGGALLDGVPIADCGDRLRSTVGLVFQDADAQIVGETVLEDASFGPENLRSGRSLARRSTDGDVRGAVQTALTEMELWDKRDASPRRLSGGEKRRLAIAGVLAMGCEVVIMDEPFANLDWPSVRQVVGTLRRLKKSGRTLIILTHELEKVLALADRLLILRRGRLMADGAPEAVLETLDPDWGVRDPRVAYQKVEDCLWL